MKDELTSLGFDIYFFKASSFEERVIFATLEAVGGPLPTICRDWAKEWASRDTEHWFVKEQRNSSE